MNKNNIIYSATFTSATGGLYLREISALLPLIQSEDYKTLLKAEILENRFIKINAQSSRKKVINLLLPRLSYAFKGFWDVFQTSSVQEQALLLFYLTIKAEPIVRDFHQEVTLPAWRGSARNFDPFSYQMKIDEIGNAHENVAKWSEETREQMVTIYKRILKETGFLKDDNLVLPRQPDEFYFAFVKNRETWFLESCFLSQSERERIVLNFKQTQ